MKVMEPRESSKEDYRALKISTAFANLAVRDRDIVAVAFTVVDEKLEVIISSSLFMKKHQSFKQQASASLKFLSTKNFREQDQPKSTNKEPLISDLSSPELPDDMIKTHEDLLTYLQGLP